MEKLVSDIKESIKYLNLIVSNNTQRTDIKKYMSDFLKVLESSLNELEVSGFITNKTKNRIKEIIVEIPIDKIFEGHPLEDLLYDISEGLENL